MRALVIGASGMVGNHLMGALRDADVPAIGTFAHRPLSGLLPLDVSDHASVEKCVAEIAPSVIYLAGALTNVDYCETHSDESFAVTVDGARHVAATGCRIVYFSTDYVFAGEAGPYEESDAPGPINVYGRHKLLAEQSLPSSALIVRTTVVYGQDPHGKDFVSRVRRVLGTGERLRVPIDQIGSPTYAPNLVRAVVALERRGARGIYHVCGPVRASRYDFAREAAQVFDLDPDLVEPATTHALGQEAPRPLNAGMCTRKAQAELPFPLLDYRAGLMAHRDALLASDKD